MESGFGTGYYKINPPQDARYKNLNEVGFLPRYVSLAKDGLNYTSQLDPTFKKYKDHGYDTKKLEEESDYELVRALEENCWTSIDKCDTKPYRFKNDPIYNLSVEFADLLLEKYLEAKVRILNNQLKMDSAPGAVYSMHKIRTKRDALISTIYNDLIGRHNYIPLAGIATKQEFLSNEDLARGKVRTTFTSPLDLIMKQKLFFQEQNEKIKMGSREEWIKYGMKKQYGGFNRFLKEMEEYSHVFQSDASGYDRTAFLLDVYYLRWKHLEYPAEFEELLFWTMFHSIFPFCVCPNGLIFMRQCGNNSGANNTASDNSILHLIIILYLFIYAFQNKHGRLPNLGEIDENVELGIYSDDKLGAADFKFFGWETIEDFQRDEIEVYKRFNMVIKPSSILVTENKPGQPIDPRHEFLGSSATYDKDFKKYIGYPRVGKICSSVTRKGVEDLNEADHFTKIMQLKCLAYAEPWLYQELDNYTDFIMSQSKQKMKLKQIKELHEGRVRNNMLNLHFGFESNGVIRQGNFGSKDHKDYLAEQNFYYNGNPRSDWLPHNSYDYLRDYRNIFNEDDKNNNSSVYISEEQFFYLDQYDRSVENNYFFFYHDMRALYGRNELDRIDFNHGSPIKRWYHDDKFKTFYFFLCHCDFYHGGRMDLKSIISVFIQLMANARVRRGEQILAALSSPNISALLPEGKQAIMQRFDPFHDLPSKSAGYPDDFSGSTVTRLIKKSVTFNSESGEGSPATGPWNFHVFNTPILTPVHCTEAASTISLGSVCQFNKDAQATIEYGGLMVIRSDTSEFDNCPPDTTGNFLAQLKLDPEDIDATSRVIAQGWELRDNTANIVKQGMVTVYRQNEPQLKDFYLNAYDSGNGANASKKFIRSNSTLIKMPPTNVSDALLLQGSKQWLLKDGVYCVTTFHDSEIPMSVPEPNCISLIHPWKNVPVGSNFTETVITNLGWTTRSTGFPAAGDWQTTATIPTTVPTTIDELVVPFIKLAPFNQSGAMCMGAPPEGSYTLTLNTYVEEAVGLDNKPFVTLGMQSPVYSPLAIRCMSILTHDSPIAVKIDENYLGEWFIDGMADIAKSVAPWFGNAQTVSNQIIKWADSAKVNNGIFQTPQTFVKGSVNNQLKKEKKSEKKGNAVPKAPGPAPKKRAYQPKPVVKQKVINASIKKRAKKTNNANRTHNAEYIRFLEQQNRAALARGYLSSNPKKITRKKRKA